MTTDTDLRALAEAHQRSPFIDDGTGCICGEVDCSIPALLDDRDGYRENLRQADLIIGELTARSTALAEALEGMVGQFAYWHDKAGGYQTGGLSALEDAFDVLGWDDPHPEPAVQCDEPGCKGQITCGWPSPGGYRRTCGEHYRAARALLAPPEEEVR